MSILGLAVWRFGKLNLKEWNKDEGLPNVSSLGTGFNELQEGGLSRRQILATGTQYSAFAV
jgi:hypothetical protein